MNKVILFHDVFIFLILFFRSGRLGWGIRDGAL